MKLVKQNSGGFQYQVNQEEARFLRLLVHQFPIGAFSPVTISKTDSRAVERAQLLNESLAAHREELKQKAKDLVGDDKFKVSEGHQFFKVSREGRETLLQVLNDIRVESWRILGEPENLEMNPLDVPREKIRHYQSMQLAGYFECCFLNLEEGQGR